MPGEGIQGDEWAAYVPLDTYDKDERGIGHHQPGRYASCLRHEVPRGEWVHRLEVD